MSENDALQVSCCGRHGIVGCERCFGSYRVVRPMVRRTELDELRAERDSLAASLEEAREELEGQRARKETAREALASTTHAALRERAELSELRARVEAAVAELREFVAQGVYEFEAKTAPEAFLQQELKDIISRVRAILSPPEGERE